MWRKSLGFTSALCVVILTIALMVTSLMPASAQNNGPALALRIVGVLEELNTDNVVVSGQTYDTTNADVDAGLAVGDLVEVKFTLDLATNTRVATEVRLFEAPEVPMPEFHLVGELEEIGAEFVVVFGFTFDTATATVESGLAVGDWVHVRFTIDAAANLIASEVTKVEVPEPPMPPPAGELKIYGRLQAVDANSVQVAGRTFDTTNATVEAGLVVGDWVEVVFTIQADLTLVASSVTKVDEPTTPEPPNPPLIHHIMLGELEALNSDSVLVNGTTFDTTNAEVDADLVVGDWVRVRFFIAPDETFVAEEVAKLELPEVPNRFTAIGPLTALDASTAVIGGLTYDVTAATVETGVEVGDWVRVVFTIEAESSTVTLVAQEIFRVATPPVVPPLPPIVQPPLPTVQPPNLPTVQPPNLPTVQPPQLPTVQPPHNGGNSFLSVVGRLDAMGTDTVTVNGQIISTVGVTLPADLAVGMTVRVEIRVVNGVRSGTITILPAPPNITVQPPQLPTIQPPQLPTIQPPQLPTIQPPQLPTIQPPQLPTFQPPQLPPLPTLPPFPTMPPFPTFPPQCPPTCQ